MREELLALLAAHGVQAVFSGHYHRNGGGLYTSAAGESLEVIVTGACGVNVSTRATGNRLNIDGMGGPRDLSADVSGMRLVRLHDALEHEWCTFAELAAMSPEDAARHSMKNRGASPRRAPSAPSAAPARDESELPPAGRVDTTGVTASADAQSERKRRKCRWAGYIVRRIDARCAVRMLHWIPH